MKPGTFCYEYPHPAITADCIIFCLHPDDLKCLLIQRKHDPFAGYWALPGGFVDIDEDIETGARRELMEETGITDLALKQFMTFGDVGRDPRERVITVTYIGFVRYEEKSLLKAGDDAGKAEWKSLTNLPVLAFDHNNVLTFALRNIGHCLHEYLPFFPDSFSLPELHAACTIIYNDTLFAEKMIQLLLQHHCILKNAADGQYTYNKNRTSNIIFM